MHLNWISIQWGDAVFVSELSKYRSQVFQWMLLTHWGRVTYICVSDLTIIGSDKDLSPGRRQAIIWTNSGILLIGPLGINLSEILNKIYTFSFKKMHLKMWSEKWRPFCLSLNVVKQLGLVMPYGNRDLDQYWLRQWILSSWHQAINYLNQWGSMPLSKDQFHRNCSWYQFEKWKLP